MSKRHRKVAQPTIPAHNCGNCFYGRPIADPIFREVYPDMELQCDRQKYPGAVFFTNTTMLITKAFSCFSWSAQAPRASGPEDGKPHD